MDAFAERLRGLTPARLWDDAGRRLETTPWGRSVTRYGPYVVLPLLAVVAGLSPHFFDTRWTFLIIVAVSYVLMGSRSGVLGVVLLALVLAWLPREMDKFEQGILFNVALYTLLGIGLNVVVGYAGLLDLGYVAFFATGAYAYALTSAPERGGGYDLGLGFWAVLPMAICLAALVGVLLGIPVLRLRGDYLAIVTLGFGEIIRIMINNQTGITNGAQGVFSIPDTSFAGWEIASPVEFFYLLLVFCFIAGFASERLLDSRVGRAWEAMREDQDVAASMGIDTTFYKLIAFAIGAAIGAAGGVVFAAKTQFVSPDNFDLAISINVLAIVIVGGMGNMRSVILGSFLLIGLPDVLRDFSVNVGPISLENLGTDYRLVIFGAALVLVMVLRPQGLIPSRRRRTEFEHIDERETRLAT